jgi:hypothetical protein
LWSLTYISNKIPINILNYTGKLIYDKIDLGWISYIIHEFVLIPNKLFISDYFIILSFSYKRTYIILFLILICVIFY